MADRVLDHMIGEPVHVGAKGVLRVAADPVLQDPVIGDPVHRVGHGHHPIVRLRPAVIREAEPGHRLHLPAPGRKARQNAVGAGRVSTGGDRHGLGQDGEHGLAPRLVRPGAGWWGGPAGRDHSELVGTVVECPPSGVIVGACGQHDPGQRDRGRGVSGAQRPAGRAPEAVQREVGWWDIARSVDRAADDEIRELLPSLAADQCEHHHALRPVRLALEPGELLEDQCQQSLRLVRDS